MTDLLRYETNRERAEKICALRHLEPETPEWFERRNDLETAMNEAQYRQEKETREIYDTLQKNSDKSSRQMILVLGAAFVVTAFLAIFMGRIADDRGKERDVYKVRQESAEKLRADEKQRADSCAAREERFEERLQSRSRAFEDCHEAFWTLWKDCTVKCGREPPAFQAPPLE